MDEHTYGDIRALIVDDSAFARNVGRRILKVAGVGAILEESSCRQALELLQDPGQPIDIVFSDLMMPDMDGVQFLRHAADLQTTSAFVLVSGAESALLTTVATVARARRMRVLGAIEKPLTLAATRRVVLQIKDAAPVDRAGEWTKTEISAEDLAVALNDFPFLLHFQPKISLADGKVQGFEALARWQHPEHGLIPPAAFIAAAEQNGMIGALTDRTMTLALRQCAGWAAAGLHTAVSLNLSAYMLVDIDLPDRLAREAAQFGVEPGRLILEVTESGLFLDTANTLEILARLHMKGFPLSIDDFGTGYSSLEQLSRIPFAEMKIDRSFVHGVAGNPRMKAILESSTNLGRRLGMTVVAEGAETQEDWDMLREIGVNLVQGYYIARPMAPEDVQPWVLQWEARSDPHPR